MIESKKITRFMYLMKRKSMKKHEVEDLSTQISNIISSNINLSKASIALYYPVNNEVDIRDLSNKCRKALLPVFNFETKKIRFAIWDSYLEVNKYGIHEPKDPVFDLDIDYVFVPLVAFNQDLHRIGYGGGAYDKTIEFYRNHIKPSPKFIGVAFSSQMAEFSPEEFDQILDGIITEDGIIGSL
ncbi:MAG: 5-formyltetrahydrofolate cyclo-ligase [Alphaproteobacteria bacterium]|nr:5-formyltetrahydrofolate cyclo-ligase [Alphaproteobacteria bacterium]